MDFYHQIKKEREVELGIANPSSDAEVQTADSAADSKQAESKPSAKLHSVMVQTDAEPRGQSSTTKTHSPEAPEQRKLKSPLERLLDRKSSIAGISGKPPEAPKLFIPDNHSETQKSKSRPTSAKKHEKHHGLHLTVDNETPGNLSRGSVSDFSMASNLSNASFFSDAAFTESCSEFTSDDDKDRHSPLNIDISLSDRRTSVIENTKATVQSEDEMPPIKDEMTSLRKCESFVSINSIDFKDLSRASSYQSLPSMDENQDDTPPKPRKFSLDFSAKNGKAHLNRPNSVAGGNLSKSGSKSNLLPVELLHRPSSAGGSPSRNPSLLKSEVKQAKASLQMSSDAPKITRSTSLDSISKPEQNLHPKPRRRTSVDNGTDTCLALEPNLPIVEEVKEPLSVSASLDLEAERDDRDDLKSVTSLATVTSLNSSTLSSTEKPGNLSFRPPIHPNSPKIIRSMSQNSLHSDPGSKKTPKSAAELIDEAAKLIDGSTSQSNVEDKYNYPEKFEVPIVKRKREETVSDQVPSPEEIREKLEKVVEGNLENKLPKKEETAQERRKRIRMMLLNSINGETVTDEVKQKQEEEKRAAEKAETERIEAEARAERLKKELAERQAAERERHRLLEEEKLKKKRAEEAERKRKLEEQEEQERRRRRAPRCIADRKARKFETSCNHFCIVKFNQISKGIIN